jgi:hypothetical protein
MDGYNKQAILNNNGKTCINTLSERFQNHTDNHGNKAKSMPLAHIYIQMYVTVRFPDLVQHFNEKWRGLNSDMGQSLSS